jgi:hypothetical protein
MASTYEGVKLGLLFLDTKRLKDRLIPIVKDRRITKEVQKQLGNFEESILKNYRLFFSYAIKDSDTFQIKQMADYWESRNSNIQVRYFERDKKMGRDILEYMESGIAWCNRFVSFHSENSLKSDAVQQEYKMAQYEGKKVFTITNNPATLPLWAKSNAVSTWNGMVSTDLKGMLEKIINL